MKELHLTKEAVANKLSDPMKKAIPVILIFGGIMAIAVVMSNAPPVIDAVADRVVGKPDVFVMTPEEYEQWEIDNGLKGEGDRRYIAGLGEDEYQAYLDAGGEPYDPGAETFLGVVQGDKEAGPDTFLGVQQEETESKVQTYLGVEIEPALVPEGDIPLIDFIPPVLTAPEILIFEADNTHGMKPKLHVLVVDNIDEGLVADCEPSKNKVFAIGKHDVECHAIDSSENIGYVDFTIEIVIRDDVDQSVGIIPKIQPMPGQGFP